MRAKLTGKEPGMATSCSSTLVLTASPYDNGAPAGQVLTDIRSCTRILTREQLRLCLELGVDLQSDDDLPPVIRFRVRSPTLSASCYRRSRCRSRQPRHPHVVRSVPRKCPIPCPPVESQVPVRNVPPRPARPAVAAAEMKPNGPPKQTTSSL